jgi:hypothetical protein
MVNKQFLVVTQLIANLQRYIFKRKALMSQFEGRDIR